MIQEVFKGFGIEILRREGKPYLRYDSGHFVTQMKEDEVSEDEAAKAQLSEADAYQVLLAVQAREPKSGGLKASV